MRNLFATFFSTISFFLIWMPFFFPDRWVRIGDTHAVFYGWYSTWVYIVITAIVLLAIRKLYEIGEYIFDKIQNN